jgi:predicted enzyme related to lactoylglutathione lyase
VSSRVFVWASWNPRSLGTPGSSEDPRTSSLTWLYLKADAERAGGALLTISVAGLERTVEEIRSRGIECGAIEEVGDAGRKATLTDPDGNTISFVQVAAS